MIRRILAIGATSIVVAASTSLIVAAPAFAAPGVSFSPTSDLTPGTDLTNLVVTATNSYLCEQGPGTETQTGSNVVFGVAFYDSADDVWDEDDTWIGRATDNTFQTYTQGDTSSDPITAEMPVLERHNSANYIVARGYCFDVNVEWGIDHGDGITVTYDDLTFPTPNAAQGKTSTAHIIDATSAGQFCAVEDYGLNEPYSIGLEFYSSFDAWVNDDDAVVMLPETWAQNGPGLGSFAAADLANGVDIEFAVPSNLPVGEYQVYAFCIDGDGTTAGGTTIGLQPFSVTAAALPNTGGQTSSLLGVAGVGAGLLILGALVWSVRRRLG